MKAASSTSQSVRYSICLHLGNQHRRRRNPEQITKLVRQLRASKVPSLFVESSVDDRPMKTVSQETGLPIFSTIFTDSVAESGKDGDSYYSMMKWNLDKIIEGLSK